MLTYVGIANVRDRVSLAQHKDWKQGETVSQSSNKQLAKLTICLRVVNVR